MMKVVFSLLGLILWNTLPRHIKQATTISHFKTLLNTFLFNSSCFIYFLFCSFERLEIFF